MRIWTADRSCFLFELLDLHQQPAPALVEQHRAAVRPIVEWAGSYLCSPHAELGRDGPVCPFVPLALKSELFFINVQPGAALTPGEVAATVIKYRDWFLEIEPRSGREAHYKTILIVFPDITAEAAPALIDATQRLLKPAFVAEGLMIGQFHPLPPEVGGLWNAAFRPLYSPLPLLAIRNMVASDLPFLTSSAAFVESYLNLYQGQLTRRQREQVQLLLSRLEPDQP